LYLAVLGSACGRDIALVYSFKYMKSLKWKKKEKDVGI